MQPNRLGGPGLLLRFLVAMGLVYATYNPEGLSYFHWSIVPIFSQGIGTVGALKVVSGILL
ncbi:MAG: DUF6524 family protein, partial [Gemmatimonadales bacterium]